jgi:hypothetical protein
MMRWYPETSKVGRSMVSQISLIFIGHPRWKRALRPGRELLDDAAGQSNAFWCRALDLRNRRERLAFVLQERWESNNIHARSDIIREIPVKTSSIAMVGLRPRRMI